MAADYHETQRGQALLPNLKMLRGNGLGESTNSKERPLDAFLVFSYIFDEFSLRFV
jgi:hypothetical protein